MRFFFDNNLSPKLARSLDALVQRSIGWFISRKGLRRTQAWKFAKVFPNLLVTAERARKGRAFFITPNAKIEEAETVLGVFLAR